MLTNPKIIIIYTVMLSIFGLFTTMFFENPDPTSFDSETSSGIQKEMNNFFSKTNINEEEGLFNKGRAIAGILFYIPILIFKLLFQIFLIPFLAISYLPSIVAVLIYTPYTIILFFDVLIPLFIKLLDVIGDYIPFT